MNFNFNFKNAVVQSGKKVIDESKSTLQLLSTFNNFKLNIKAMQEMGIAPGGRVLLMDLGSQAPDLENRWFLTPGFKHEGKELGAKLTANQRFTYSVVYGAILAQDMDVISITPESLIERGLVYPKQGTVVSTQYISAKVAVADLVPFADGEPQEIFDGVEVPLWRVANIKFEDYTPKNSGGSDDELDME